MTSDDRSAAARMLPRPVHDRVRIMQHGHINAKIVSPSDSAWRAAAARLAQAMGALLGDAPQVLQVESAFDRQQLSMTASRGEDALIFIGHVGVNPAMLELYARRIFVVDDQRPGCATVQTHGNPWGDGRGAVVVGASAIDQIEQAIDLFITHCKRYLQEGDLLLPRICDPGPDLLVAAANKPYWQRLIGEKPEPWCAALLESPAAHLGYEEARQMHELTALTDLGVWNPQQVHQLEQVMLEAVLAMPDKVWWYPGPSPRNGRVGGRHENFKAPRLLLLVRHLLQVGRPDEAARDALEKVRQPLERYLDDVLSCTYRNDHEGSEAASGWQAMVWAAMAMGKSCYFHSGMAKQAAFHAFLETDNHGASASHCQFGGVENLYEPSELRVILEAAAWWDDDGRYRWLLENLPYVAHTSYSFPLRLRSGSDSPPARPDHWLGMQWQTLSTHAYESSVHDKRWRQPAMARERTVDVLTCRSGFGTSDQYLAIDGFQNHFQPLGLGAILRYVDLGKLFLVAHTGAQGNYYKSGLAVSRGVIPDGSDGDTCEPWGGELVVAVQKQHVSLAALRCAEYHGSDWTRHIIWCKDRYFLVMDHVQARSPGLYMLSSTWRTGFPAMLEGNNWRQQQGEVTFHLKPAGAPKCHAGREPEHSYPNEVVPYVLRQHEHLHAAQAGDGKTMTNLIHATSPQRPALYEVATLGDDAVIIRGDNHFAVAGRHGYDDGVVSLQAAMFHLSDEGAVLASPTRFTLRGTDMLHGETTADVELKWNASQADEMRQWLESIWDKAQRSRQADRVTVAGDAAVVDGGLSRQWNARPFGGVHQRIDLMVERQAQTQHANRWVVDLQDEQDVHDVTVSCDTHRLTGGEGWPGFNTQPASAQPMLLGAADAQASMAQFITAAGDVQTRQGALIHRHVGPYNKSCYAHVPCVRFSGAPAKRVMLDLPADMSVKQVDARGAQGPATIIGLQLCETADDPGQANLICRTHDDQLAMLDSQGHRLWHRRFDRKILAVAALKLGDGAQRQVVVSDAGANLWRIAQDGRVLACETLNERDRPGSDFFNQDLIQNRPYALGTWQQPGDAQPALFMGTYQSVAWRHADGRLTCWPAQCVQRGQHGQQQAPRGRVGIAWRGLIYWDRVLREGVDLNGDGVDDQVALGRGFATSPMVMFIDGATHEVFAEHPFPNGATLGLQRVTLAGQQRILAVNEFQLGLYTLDGRVVRTLSFDTPVAGYALQGERLHVAKRDGMLLSFDGKGDMVASATLHGPLHDVAAGEHIIVAGDDRLELLSRDLQPVGSMAMRCLRLLHVSQTKVAAAGRDGSVALLVMD